MSNDRAIAALRRGLGSGLLFVVAGPSGAGKNSIIDRVLDNDPGLTFSISYTTRPRRDCETDGVDYIFVSHEAFNRLVDEGEFVEHVTYQGDQYGTSRSQIRCVISEGRDPILNIDVEGARSLQATGIPGCKVVYIFLVPSSLDRLAMRLRARGTENEAEIAGRLQAAAREMDAVPLFDYLVINDDLDVAAHELSAIIAAERLRILP